MVKIENDIDNIFDTPKITDPRLDVFTTSAITKLTAANTSGDYTDVIAELVAVHEPFHLNISNLKSDFVTGMGKTELRVNVIDGFKEFVSNNKGPVKSKYFKTHHDIYIGFYPYDLKDYGKMNKTTAQGLIDRYAKEVHTNAADFPPQFDLDAAAFSTRYSNALEIQDKSKGSISDDRTGRGTGRKELNVKLFKAYNFAKYKSECDYDFMNGIFPLDTLEKHARHNIKHYTGNEDALASINVAQAIYDEFDWVMLHNSGITDQRIGLELTADAPAGTLLGKVVKAGKNKSFRIISLGAAGNHFLNITNLNLTEGGSWKIDTYRKE